MTDSAKHPLERLPLPGGGELAVEARGVPARHREQWVLLHGLGATRRAPLLRHLLRRLRERGAALLLPDLPGHGASGADPADLSLAAGLAALDLLDRRWGRRGGDLRLVGFSYGGLIAAWWAALHPERVRGLVLGAPAFGFHARLRELAGPAGWRRARAAGRLELEGPRGPVVVGGRALAEEEEFPSRRLEEELRTPTLVLHGLEDQSLPWRDSLAFVTACAAPAELCLLPGAGHTFAGREEDFFRRLIAFAQGGA